MKNSILLILGIILAAGLWSCDKDIPTAHEDQSKGTTPYVIETDDKLSVKTDVETFAFGTPEGEVSFSTALFKRLTNRVGAFNPQTTKAIVIFNNALQSLTREDYINIYICHRSGGSIVIVEPQSESFNPVIRTGLKDAALYLLIDKFNAEGVDREQVKTNLENTLFKVNLIAEGHEGETFECLGFYPGHTYSCDLLPKEGVTPYQYGLSADGCARWINDTQKGESTKSFVSSFTKAGGGEISEYTDAEVFRQTHNVSMERSVVTEKQDPHGNPYLEDLTVTYPEVVENIVKVYTAYSEGQKADYYQVDQKFTLYNGRVDPVPDITDDKGWWPKNEGVKKDNSLAGPAIYPLKEFHNTMFLEETGIIEIMDSHPQTTNGSCSSSVSTTEGTTNTLSGGIALGLVGGLLGKFSSTFSLGFSHAETYSSTVGTSRSVSDISVVKNTDASGKVKWDYTGAELKHSDVKFDPMGRVISEMPPTWWAAPLLLTDCAQQNSILFRVSNPSGVAKIHSSNNWKYSRLWLYANNKFEEHNDIITDESAEDIFTIGHPIRYYEDWTLSCVNYGDLNGKPGYIALFESQYSRDILNGINKTNPVGARDENDMTPINELLNQFILEFSYMQDSYKAMGYTGKFTFQMKGTKSSRAVTASYTVE